eukprot:TRINITY_DN1423_c1_g1_i1.p1 TRINITY_DN1423_c1_g1~~TRINITY_DN1423_c1_g1_i1.p1  ORF type:complete len:338 (+),score=15.15 TRINITY_DN1423_c1_g1_i1:625-1638(+)
MNEIYLKWDPSRDRDATLGLQYDENLVLRAVGEDTLADPLAKIHIGRVITHVDSMPIHSKQQLDKLLWTAVDRVAIRFDVPIPLRISPPPPERPAYSVGGYTEGSVASSKQPVLNSSVKAPPKVVTATARGVEKSAPPKPPPAKEPVKAPGSVKSEWKAKEVAAATQTDPVPVPTILDPEKAHRAAVRREKRDRNFRTIQTEQAAIRKMQKVVENLGAAALRREGPSGRVCPMNHVMEPYKHRPCSLCKLTSEGLHCRICYYTMCWGCAPIVRQQPLHCHSVELKPNRDQSVQTATPSPTPQREHRSPRVTYRYNNPPVREEVRREGPAHYRFRLGD